MLRSGEQENVLNIFWLYVQCEHILNIEGVVDYQDYKINCAACKLYDNIGQEIVFAISLILYKYTLLITGVVLGLLYILDNLLLYQSDKTRFEKRREGYVQNKFLFFHPSMLLSGLLVDVEHSAKGSKLSLNAVL